MTDAAEIFERACDLPPEQRDAFVREACDGDSRLAHEVRELLAADASGGPIGATGGEAPGSNSWIELARPKRESSRRRRRRRDEEQAAKHRPLWQGSVVGDFKLERLLGQGGMGQVWEATQVSLGRRVALKLIHPDRLTGRAKQLFEREARAGARLHHPGIVAVHAAGEADGVAFIAQELVEDGRTLGDLIDDARAAQELPDDYFTHTTEFIAKIADALQVAHDGGVIHRDLKPQNVLVAKNGGPKVTDFGLARVEGEMALSRTGEFAGTYYYMSPEQALARRIGIDHRTDVFSLGVVLYECLALRRPFDGDTTHQVIEKIAYDDPVDPRAFRSRVPRDLAVICQKALEKRRDDRYPDMAALASDLRRALANEPIVARAPGALRRAQKWALRHPAVSVGLGIGVVALAVISVLLIDNVRARSSLEDANVELAATADRERTRADEVFRLAAISDLERLVQDADALWPPTPDRVEEATGWKMRAEALLADLPKHEAKRAEIAAVATGLDANGEPLFERSEDAWWHAELERLEAGLHALADPETGLAGKGVSDEHGWGIEQRIEVARRLETIAATEDARERWNESIAYAAEAWPYDGLTLQPAVDLLPLGSDPTSGLLEFLVIASGTEPLRGAEGTLEPTPDMGIVLVLIPGGTFLMGAQNVDVGAPAYDSEAKDEESPVREVYISPFFLSKFEMTQGQWLELTGSEPSFFGEREDQQWNAEWSPDNTPATLLHPVERVNWEEARRVLHRLALEFPTEAQWEYAARARTTTVFWTGDAPESLEGAANLFDISGRTWFGDRDPVPFDDGYAAPAPVGSYRPNPFGFHDVHGNVREWVLDGYGPYDPDDVEDPLAAPTSTARVHRGGSFGADAKAVRSSARFDALPTNSDDSIGVRPARALRRP